MQVKHFILIAVCMKQCLWNTIPFEWCSCWFYTKKEILCLYWYLYCISAFTTGLCRQHRINSNEQTLFAKWLPILKYIKFCLPWHIFDNNHTNMYSKLNFPTQTKRHRLTDLPVNVKVIENGCLPLCVSFVEDWQHV